MTHNFYPNDFASCFRIKVDMVVPELAVENNYKDWALAILNFKTLPDASQVSALESIDGHDRLFIKVFLHTSRLLCELGNLPIFDIPRVISLSQDKQNAKKYILDVDFSSVLFVPQAAYQIPIKASLELCRWMAQSNPTSDNKIKVFNMITERVIKPLQRLVPSGKSTIPVLREAYYLGIPFCHLGAGVYQLGWGSKAHRMNRSATELDSSIGAILTQNKAITVNILRLAGLPAPNHFVVNTEAEAVSAADRLGYKVVIKPTDLNGGAGVTVDVYNGAAVKLAFTHAHELSKSKQVLVERQVAGICHRLFIANGLLLYAVKRMPMSVRGNGRSTVIQLVEDEVSAQKNKAPWNRSEIKPIDERALKALALAGFSPYSIPEEGVWVPLRQIESTADGGVDEEVTTTVHPENLSAAIAATKLFGLHIAGIDIITTDISKPWYENGAVINEVNFAPLFGGGEISRSYIPKFFAHFMNGDGKIPIETFDSEDEAIVRQREYCEKGLRCFFTSSAQTIDFAGNLLNLPFANLRQRLQALIYRSDVDAITVYMPHRKAKSQVENLTAKQDYTVTVK